MKLQFAGSRALILGGSSDLGIETAERLIQEAITPFLTFRNPEGKQKIQDNLKDFQGKYELLYIDLQQVNTIDAAFQKIELRLDYLVDCLHGRLESLVGMANRSDVSDYFAVNVSARAEVIKQVGRVMLKNRFGRMVFISSVAAGHPNIGQGFYAAAKLASEALYKTLGREMQDRGIITICLRPGYIDAGRGQQYLQTSKEQGRPPLEAFSAQTVAETVVFLLSEQAAGLDGATLTIGEENKRLDRNR